MSKRLELLPLTVHISLFLGKVRQSRERSAVLKAEGIKTLMPAPHALMEPMLEAFERACRCGIPIPTHVNFHVTGELATAEIATPEYWCRHVRQPVRFMSMQTLHQQGVSVCGDWNRSRLVGDGRQCLPEGVELGPPVCIKAVRNRSSRVWGIVRAWSASGQLALTDFPVAFFATADIRFSDSAWADAENGHPKAADLSQQKAQTAIINLLSQGIPTASPAVRNGRGTLRR